MARYRKLPVEIEAFKWTGGGDQLEDPLWAIDAIKQGKIAFFNVGTERVQLHILTLEGTMIANPGDYIIKGTFGELYPCKPAVFESIYEAV